MDANNDWENYVDFPASNIGIIFGYQFLQFQAAVIRFQFMEIINRPRLALLHLNSLDLYSLNALFDQSSIQRHHVRDGYVTAVLI